MSGNQHTEADVDANGTTKAATSAGSTFRRRGRLIAAASLAAVASLALTACGGNGQDNAQGSTKVSTSPQPEESSAGGASNGSTGGMPSKDGAAEGQQKPQAGKTGGNSEGAGGSGTGGSESGSGSAGGSASAPKGKGVNATVSGVLKYMAPGKLTVAPASGTEQAFFVGSQTKTLGAATICASNGNVTMDSKGNGTSPCTEKQLEKAAKLGSVEVQVTIKGGIATKVVEHYRS
ncbi:hypothetical protein ACWC9R_07250 [Streptomyces sp. NPDC001219]